MTAFVTALRGRRQFLVAMGLAFGAGMVSLTLLPGGEAAQAAASPMVQSLRMSAPDVRTTQKADRLVKPMHLQGGCDGAWGNEPLDCLLRSA